MSELAWWSPQYTVTGASTGGSLDELASGVACSGTEVGGTV